MSFLDLFQSAEKTVGLAAFDHPTVHNQLTTGSGPGGLSQASKGLANDIATRLENMDSNLKHALATSQGAWTGHASESASASTTPLTKAVRSSREISMEIGKQVDHQTEHFGKVKTMPPPKKVDPLDLGIGGYTPGGFLAEQIDKEIQERQANAVEEQARQQYMTYQESTKSTTGNLTRFSPVPNPLTTLETADTRPPDKVDSNIDTLSKTDTGESGNPNSDNGDSNNRDTDNRDSDNRDSDNGDSDNGDNDRDSDHKKQPDMDDPPENPGPKLPDDDVIWEIPPAPDETDSDSTTPAPPAPAPPTPGPSGPGAPGGGGGTMAGGVIGGAALGGGSQAGSLGTGGRALGAGGTSGVGGTGSGSATSGSGATGARGTAGAGAMGAGAGQRGKGSEEEQDHERKYVEDTDEPFEFDDEIDPGTGYHVAPPVIGQNRPPSGR